MPLTILDGGNFCICDDAGDVAGPSEGFFAFDTRFLSRLAVRVNGARPLPLSSGKVEYFSAAFFLRNPVAGGLRQDELTIVRERFVGDAMQERIAVRSYANRALAFELELEIAADFADILTVKQHDFTLGRPDKAPPLPSPVAPVFDEELNGFLLVSEDEGFSGQTRVLLSERGDVDAGAVRFGIELEPGEEWVLTADVFPSEDAAAAARSPGRFSFGHERTRVRESLRAWNMLVPELRAEWPSLQRSYDQSVADLASLRIGHHRRLVGQLPAAGMPWFMTVFGRDTLLTCYQTFLFGPDLARGALATLAELQATDDDPERDAEPGKILHELRGGKAALTWFPRYYGTVDATALFIVLACELGRWTGDLGRGLREPLLRALAWIDEHGDRDGDGFIEYKRRSPRGLENQSWKDSGNSQLFHDGTRAEPPIAPCEAQGYVFDAKTRLAEVARTAWNDPVLAERLERDAQALRRRFDEAFWCEERGGYYALALDGEKRRVDSLTSNMGHLLWSGIVPEERVDAVVAQLMGEPLWSGWGVRTMAASDAGFNPLSYHNGSIWPHDNSLIAMGLARYGRWEEAHRIVRSLVEASPHFDHQLPEVFAGYRRDETPFPIVYPTAARPQAWAAGTPILLLRVLLGLHPDPGSERLVSVSPAGLADWAGPLDLRGVVAFGKAWNVFSRRGEIRVEQA